MTISVGGHRQSLLRTEPRKHIQFACLAEPDRIVTRYRTGHERLLSGRRQVARSVRPGDVSSGSRLQT